METFEVRSLPLKEVIRDLAEQWNTTYTENCEQYILRIPKHYGSGEITGINFASGLGLLQYNCRFKNDVEIKFIVNEIHPLKFLFCAKGTLSHWFEHEEVEHEIHVLKSAIVASSNHNGHILKFKANQHTIIHSLEIARKDFIHKISCEINSISTKLKNLFLDAEAVSVFYYDGFYSIQISELFEQMHGFDQQDFLKKIFLEGKSYEILTQHILQYEDDLKQVGEQSVFRKSEMMQIDLAATMIKNEISEVRNVEEIARHVGLSKRKLQEGFKSVFKLTVNAYMQKVRLELARDLLINTKLSISEISYRTGISSKSYFSKIFSEHYHTTPKKFRETYGKFNDA